MMLQNLHNLLRSCGVFQKRTVIQLFKTTLSIPILGYFDIFLIFLLGKFNETSSESSIFSRIFDLYLLAIGSSNWGYYSGCFA